MLQRRKRSDTYDTFFNTLIRTLSEYYREECGGWDLNPRTPKGRGIPLLYHRKPEPRAVDQAGRPPQRFGKESRKFPIIAFYELLVFGVVFYTGEFKREFPVAARLAFAALTLAVEIATPSPEHVVPQKIV